MSKLGLPSDRGGILKKVISFPAGYSNDGIFGYTVAGENYIRVQKGPLNSTEVGIYSNGIDQTARINTVLAHPKVKTIELDAGNEGDGKIVVTGTVVVPFGKTLKFHNGTTIHTTGAGIVSGGIVDAIDQIEITTGTKKYFPAYSVTGQVCVNWYGANAVGVNATVNSANANFAVQVVVNSSTLPRTVYFPDVAYDFAHPIVTYKFETGEYRQHYVELRGCADNAMLGFGTELRFQNGNLFGVGIQQGKGVVVSGFKIQGVFNPSFADMKVFVETPVSSFGGGVRATQYTPHVGVVMEPFSSVVPPDGGWTGMPTPPEGGSSWYRGTMTRSGSTLCQIRFCHVSQWLLDIGFSINGETQNCDSMVVQDCNIDTARYGIAYGQDQTKNCIVRNIMCWDRMHTFITNQAFGFGSSQPGCPPTIDNISLAGTVNQIFDCNTQGRFGFTASRIFAESLYRIGTVVGQPSSIRDSMFNFMLADYADGAGGLPQLGAPDVYGLFTNVTFDTCMMRNYDNNFNKRLHMIAAGCLFINCKFDVPPILSPWAEGRANKFIGCSYGASVIGYLGQGNITCQEDYMAAGAVQHGDFAVRTTLNTPYEELRTEYNFPLEYDAEIGLGNIAWAVNTTTRKATANVDLSIQAKVGDYILSTTPINMIDAAIPSTVPVLGRVASISGGVTTLDEVPINVTTGTYGSKVNFFKTIGIPFVGNLTAGSNLITNVEANNNNYPSVGQRLYVYEVFGPIPYPLHIIATNPGAKTVTMSGPAQLSLQNIVFNSFGQSIVKAARAPSFAAYTNLNRIITEGTRWVAYTYESASGRSKIVSYKAINSGWIDAAAHSSARAVQWVQEASIQPTTPGTLQYYDVATETFQTVTGGTSDFTSDSFSLITNGSRVIEALRVVEDIYLKPTVTMTIDIGTSLGGNDLAFGLELTANQTSIFSPKVAFDSGATLYFTGVSGGTLNVKIIKRNI